MEYANELYLASESEDVADLHRCVAGRLPEIAGQSFGHQTNKRKRRRENSIQLVNKVPSCSTFNFQLGLKGVG